MEIKEEPLTCPFCTCIVPLALLLRGLTSEHLAPTDLVTIKELALSNMWEVGALIELLHEKGLVTKQELFDTITELRRKHPQATKYNHPPQKQSAITLHTTSARVEEVL